MVVTGRHLPMHRLRAKVKQKGVPYSWRLTRWQLESFLSAAPWSLGWRWKHIRPHATRTDRFVAANMLTSPVRDLARYPKVQQYLADHPVVTTMTTSPQRLRKLAAVLATLDVTHLSAIFVVLPYAYGREEEAYASKDIATIKRFPHVRILRTKKDYGPLTKMLPVLRKMADKKAIVISIDDDVAYPFGMVNEVVYQKVVMHPTAVIEGGGSFFRRGDIRGFRHLWPEKKKKRSPHTDLVEGWEAVAYGPKEVAPHTELMEQIADLSKSCYLSDDLVISFVLAKKGVKRVTINNKYSYDPHPYEYGTGEDALHRGQGAGAGLQASANSDDFNWRKYRKCLKDVCKSGIGPDSCTRKT